MLFSVFSIYLFISIMYTGIIRAFWGPPLPLQALWLYIYIDLVVQGNSIAFQFSPIFVVIPNFDVLHCGLPNGSEFVRASRELVWAKNCNSGLL